MLKNNNLTKALSLLIAIILWAYVIMADNPTKTQRFDNIPVTILNEESLLQRGLTLVSGQTPRVTVVLEGKRADINKVVADEIIVTADVFGYSQGENHIPVSVQVPGTVSVADVKSNRIAVQIDELVSVAKSIKVEVEGKLPDGKELAGIELQPNEVMLTGAKSTVESVEGVYAVVDAGRFGASPTTVSVDLGLRDSEGEDVSGIKVSAANVDITSELLDLKEVELRTNISADSQYVISTAIVPDTVVIKGKADVLAGIEFVESEDVYLESEDDTGRIPISLKLPEGVELSEKSSPLSIYVAVNGLATREMKVDRRRFSFVGLGDGLSASFEEAEFTITVTGANNLVSGAVANDFTLTADLTDLKAGTYTVPLTVEYTKAFRSVAVEPREIQVTINEAE